MYSFTFSSQVNIRFYGIYLHIYLTENTFVKHVSSHYFVKFYSPWCPYCYRMTTTWEDLAKELLQVPDVIISKIDCHKFRAPYQTFEVRGYPMLLWIEDGKKVEMFVGRRSLPEMLVFVKKFIGHDEL